MAAQGASPTSDAQWDEGMGIDIDDVDDIDVERLSLDEWTDVPLPSVEEPHILCLDAPPNFMRLFSILYEMERRNELSNRALRLTGLAIQLNASNPTAWLYRQRIADKLSSSSSSSDDDEQKNRESSQVWVRELGFVMKVLSGSRKNYQAWQHRRYCVMRANRLASESQFVDVLLRRDAKNYHAWAHRAWLVRKGFVEGELDITEWYILEDVRNNSAWNHRWIVVQHTIAHQQQRQPPTLLHDEVSFACHMIQLAPRNECGWNYLAALHKVGADISDPILVAKRCVQVDAACVPARRFLILTAPPQRADEVATHCEVLASIDDIRRKYWLMQRRSAVALVQQQRRE